MTRLTLQESKDESLKILKDVAAFCDKAGIRYLIMFGTLLGAVRHKGFIPWDDDIDIAMARDDYERFTSTYKSANGYKLFCYKNDPDYIYPFAKIANVKDTVKIEAIDDGKHKRGVEIDVFVCDGAPDSKLTRWFIRKRVSYYRGMADLSRYPHYREQAKGLGVFRAIAKKVGHHHWLKKLDECTSGIPLSSCKKIWVACYPSQMKTQLFQSDIFDNRIQMEFDGELFWAPADYGSTLTAVYGPDYMTPPPPEQRLPHICEIYWT